MSYDELFEWLMKAGTGVMGWHPEATLNTDMTDIMTAYEARLGLIGDVLKAVFGSGDGGKKPAKGKEPKVVWSALPKAETLTPATFDAMFG